MRPMMTHKRPLNIGCESPEVEDFKYQPWDLALGEPTLALVPWYQIINPSKGKGEWHTIYLISQGMGKG
jgi:hypothetical protein